MDWEHTVLRRDMYILLYVHTFMIKFCPFYRSVCPYVRMNYDQARIRIEKKGLLCMKSIQIKVHFQMSVFHIYMYYQK